MLSEEALKILVPLFSAVLVAFITFFLTRSHYEKKRKDDLEDRDFNRRVAIYDMRIKEARDYVDSWDIVIGINQKFIKIFKDENNIQGIVKKAQQIIKDSPPNMSLLLNEASRKRASITILNDTELTELYEKLISNFIPHSIRLTEIVDNLEKMNRLHFKDGELETMSKSFSNAAKVVVQMKIRLDKLAQTIP